MWYGLLIAITSGQEKKEYGRSKKGLYFILFYLTYILPEACALRMSSSITYVVWFLKLKKNNYIKITIATQ